MKKINLYIILILFFKFSFLNAAEVPVTTDSRIRTLVYNANEVYDVKFHYGYQSFIEFSLKEEIETISIGEAFAWRITPIKRRLFIRPLEVEAHTNLIVITNKRTYQFDIRSQEYDGSSQEELIYTLRFYYPEEDLISPKIPKNILINNLPNYTIKQKNVEPEIRYITKVVEKPVIIEKPIIKEVIKRVPTQYKKPELPQQKKKLVIKEPIPMAKVNEDLSSRIHKNYSNRKLNFHYTYAGNGLSLTPKKVFDNGKETFFLFKNNNSVIPSINFVDKHGRERAAKYVINKDNFVVIPGIATQYSLRIGSKTLCLFNNKYLSSKDN